MQKHSESVSKNAPRVSKQGDFFRAHTHRKKAVKTGFFSLVEFVLRCLKHCILFAMNSFIYCDWVTVDKCKLMYFIIIVSLF